MSIKQKGELPKALQGVGATQPSEGEQLISEIAAIAQVTPDEVEKFFYAHDYTLAYIKEIALRGAELNQDSIEKTMGNDIVLSKSLADVAKDLNKMFPKTWRDYLSDIPYYAGFYISYPFVWIAYWLWMGVVQAKEQVWD